MSDIPLIFLLCGTAFGSCGIDIASSKELTNDGSEIQEMAKAVLSCLPKENFGGLDSGVSEMPDTPLIFLLCGADVCNGGIDETLSEEIFNDANEMPDIAEAALSCLPNVCVLSIDVRIAGISEAVLSCLDI